MANLISQLSPSPRIVDGVKGEAVTTLDSNNIYILPGDCVTWFGLVVPFGVTHLWQEIWVKPVTFEEVWRCGWTKNGQRSHIELGLELPVEERITAAIVAMRMQHGDNSEREGGGTP